MMLVAACSAAPAPASDGFPAQPLMSLASKSAALFVVVRTSPQPPTRGAQSAEYTITDAAGGEPVPGLSLLVVPWMPTMGHGTSVVPSIAEPIPGTYVVSNIYFFMPGQWVLRTTISGSSSDAASTGGAVINDYVEPSFQIP